MAPHIENSSIKIFLYLFYFDLIQGIRLSLELARKMGLIIMMKYQNFEKKLKNSAKAKYEIIPHYESH